MCTKCQKEAKHLYFFEIIIDFYENYEKRNQEINSKTSHLEQGIISNSLDSKINNKNFHC